MTSMSYIVDSSGVESSLLEIWYLITSRASALDTAAAMFWEYISIFGRFCCVSWRFRTSYSNTKVSYRFLNAPSLAWGLLFDYKPSRKRSIDTTKYIYGAGTMAALPITIVHLVPFRLSIELWFDLKASGPKEYNHCDV